MPNDQIKLLIIEDDEVDQMALKRFFKNQEDTHCEFANSVSSALELIDSNQYDAVLTDYNLGDGNAFDIIPKVKNTPVIFVTGSGDEQMAVKAMRIGAYDYLIKDRARNYLQVLPITLKNALKHHHAEIQLKESEEKYRLLVESADDIIYKTDHKGHYTYVNEVCELMTGYSRESVLGSHFLSYVAPSHRQQVEDFYKNQFLKREPTSYLEFPLVHKDGRIIWVGQQVTAIIDAHHKIEGFQAVVRDITRSKLAEQQITLQNKKLEEQNEELKTAFRKLKMAKIGKKASLIVFFISLTLFLVSEILIDPYIELNWGKAYLSFSIKAMIAFLFKPLEMAVEGYLLRQSVNDVGDFF